MSQFIEALTFICCKWRGQWNPRAEPIGILQAGKGQVVARGVCVLLPGFVKMLGLNRSYIWGQVTAITGDTASPQIIPGDENDTELT